MPVPQVCSAKDELRAGLSVGGRERESSRLSGDGVTVAGLLSLIQSMVTHSHTQSL